MNIPLLWACLPQLLMAHSENHATLLQNQIQHTETRTGMFPSLSDLKHPHHRKAALAQMKSSMMALAADTSQITPGLVQVVEGVVATLNSTEEGSALHAIWAAHLMDIEMLDDLIAEAIPIQNDFNLSIGNLTAANATVEHARQMDMECRRLVHGICNETRECRANTSDNWIIANNAVIAADLAVDTYWCEDNRNRNLSVFRTESGTKFTTYIDALNHLDTVEDTVQHCAYKEQQNAPTINNCVIVQETYSTAQCTLYGEVQMLETEFGADHDILLGNYQGLKNQVTMRERDRKTEWDVLHRVICLLSTLTDAAHYNGETHLTETAVEQCMVVHVSVTHLDIWYKQFPVLAMPPLPVHPCSSEFTFGNLALDDDCDSEVYDYDGIASAQCFCSFHSNATFQNGTLPYYFLLDLGSDLWSFTPVNLEFANGLELASPFFDSVQYHLHCVGVTPTPASLAILENNADFYSFCYGDPDASSLVGESGELTREESFVVRGGFLFMTTVAGMLQFKSVYTVAPSNEVVDISHHGDAYSLTFGNPVLLDLTEPCQDSGNIGWQPILEDWYHLEGATHFCWQGEGNHDCCAFGCFMYMYTDRVVCYANIDASWWASDQALA